nr:MAG TPA: hypothetical protein [Caudoviricetes sp.]
MFLRKDPTSSIQPIESRCSLSPPRGRVEHRQGEGAFARTHARYAHTAGFRFSCSPFTGGWNRLIERPIGVKALLFVVDEATGEGEF